MLQYRLYGGGHLPAGLEGFLKASGNIGNVVGQLFFGAPERLLVRADVNSPPSIGFAADRFGRKAVYGKELMLIIVATILCISDPTGKLSPASSLIYLACFRILVGVGVGGDYPMAASVTSDRTSVRKRGVMLAYIVTNQGWGNLIGGIVTLIVLACYRHVMETQGETSKVDGAWRIIIGISLVPAFGTLYQRLTLPESTRYLNETKVYQDIHDEVPKAEAQLEKIATNPTSASEKEQEEKVSAIVCNATGDIEATPVPEQTISLPSNRKAHFRECLLYFREWRHFKLLLGTSVCWFLVDIAFYGVNLNQNFVLQQIGFDGASGTPWHRLWKISIGDIIIAVLGFVPGYWVSVLSVEYLGRKWIQIQGFLLEALFLGILAGKFHSFSTASFVVCFAFLQVRHQFFFNFGANTTVFLYPAELFPTRYRATAHGISAAIGKSGAIISSLGFNSLSNRIGTNNVLWIFTGCCLLGAAFTLLLPEVKGRDPDVIFDEELRQERMNLDRE
ncbi:hypothetical protein EWM64_g8927 [Hericium alpestre]|uniref:Major facilitator superfamily (MFS) profile domain-containing protein n=1 Tax=Hericium alpestre TaxID=135208 RepID=A0A4Y9ZKG8_9AGAM|nr:hypothetical protein EWM64_g8927 [Hericium alpestre]